MISIISCHILITIAERFLNGLRFNMLYLNLERRNSIQIF